MYINVTRREFLIPALMLPGIILPSGTNPSMLLDHHMDTSTFDIHAIELYPH